MNCNGNRRSAVRFIVLLGLVSLFADITYEGARGITGPFLASLGASAFVVGLVAGLGEFLGNALRLLSGWLADKSRRYWTITIVGYGVNLLAVPLLALAGTWQVAALLMIAERTGKALRTPARDAILSHATRVTGHGWGFGLHEAMDQVGAMSGPLLVAAFLAARGFHEAFAILAVPALLALSVLLTARFLYPNPRDFELDYPHITGEHFPRAFWVYVAAAALMAAGFADFPFIAYHFAHTGAVATTTIPLLYSLAMGVDAVAALLFGRLFDRFGLPVLAMGAMFTAAAAPLVFLGGTTGAFWGMGFWGAGMGAQESIVKAAIAGMVGHERRASAFGIFYAGYGLFWLLGSAAMGLLYSASVSAVVTFSILLQGSAIPLLLLTRRLLPPGRTPR